MQKKRAGLKSLHISFNNYTVLFVQGLLKTSKLHTDHTLSDQFVPATDIEDPTRILHVRCVTMTFNFILNIGTSVHYLTIFVHPALKSLKV